MKLIFMFLIGITLIIISCSDNISRDEDPFISNEKNDAGQKETEISQQPDLSNELDSFVEESVDIDNQVVLPDETNPPEQFPDGTSSTEKNYLLSLYGDASYFKTDTIDGRKYFSAFDADNNLLGYAIESAHRGFDGNILNLVGFTAAGDCISVHTLEQRESWWNRIRSWFFEQFEGINIDSVTLSPPYNENCYLNCDNMYLLFNEHNVDAVTGATVTSDAIIKNVLDGFYSFDALTK